MPFIRPGILRTFRLKRRSSQGTLEELNEELSFHVEQRVERLVASGLSQEEAREAAEQRLRSGGTDFAAVRRSAKRRDRRLRARESMGVLVDDVSYALRGLARKKGFTAVAVLTLGLGVGGSTALFSAVHTLLVRPLPFSDPSELFRVTLVRPGDEAFAAPERESVWSYPKFQV